jgi:proteasome beta subunit
MTVVLALQCADGLVVACDSQITDPGRGLSYPAQKLHSLVNPKFPLVGRV